MLFKYPELLYALFLLLIPIIVHLFQLRRFEKVYFSNVDFLKKVVLQTRKSSKLKKFLILLTRLLLFAAIIIAFAQPYFSKNKLNVKPKTLIYLDNSLSMQAKNGSAELFKKAVQDIIGNYNESDEVSILTNNNFYNNLKGKDLKNQLLSLDYYPISTSINTTLLKINNELKSNKDNNQVVLISDFQHNKSIDFKLDSLVNYTFVQLKPQIKENISIDSVYIKSINAQEISLKVVLKSHEISQKNLSVSLFNNEILIQKTAIEIIKNKTTTVVFRFPFTENFNGIVRIEDNLLPFDNSLFFSLNKPEKINVLSIGKSNEFLSKIYSKNEFNFNSKTVNQLDYNQIDKQQFIVLNELKTIPNSLQEVLKTFVNLGGSLAVIPATTIDLENYNQFFNTLKLGLISKKVNAENKITAINFSHPILANVFEKQISNFQYPIIKSSYSSNFKNATTILSLENQQAFITQNKVKNGKFYWLSAAINTKNSNFKNSPLIVPVFYNLGKQSFNITNLYYIIGKLNTFKIKVKIGTDAVLKLKNKTEKFIPLQKVNTNNVEITTDENPIEATHYKVLNADKLIKNIAYNFDRLESMTNYLDIKSVFKTAKNVTYATTVSNAFKQITAKYAVKSVWKWFVLLALLFLIIEMLLLKFWKI